MTGWINLWFWATRDVLRRPGEALLSALAISSVVTAVTALLLLDQGLATTTRALLAQAPPLVVRHVGPAGWAPMPETALGPIRQVRGITQAQGRIWGVVSHGDQRITVVGQGDALESKSESVARAGLPAQDPLNRLLPQNLEPGQAVVGPFLQLHAGDTLTLDGVLSRAFFVQQVLPPSSGLLAHDIVLLHADDARALLGLPSGTLSDLALWVFHDSEVEAIQPDVAKAVPFPVQMTTRRQSSGAQQATLARGAGLRTMLMVPSLLALFLLTLAASRIQSGARGDVALLKTLGWSTAEVVRLFVLRALVVLLPSLATGWGLAYGLVFFQGAPWAGSLLWGWQQLPPVLHLAPQGVLVVLTEVAGLVTAPWLVAVLLPALRSATTDPETWLREV